MKIQKLIFALALTVTLSDIAVAGAPYCRGTMKEESSSSIQQPTQVLSKREQAELLNLDYENVGHVKYLNASTFLKRSKIFLSLLPLFYTADLIDHVNKVSPLGRYNNTSYDLAQSLIRLANEDAMKIDLTNFEQPFANQIQQRISKILTYEFKANSEKFELNPDYILKLARSSSQFTLEKYLPALQAKTFALLVKQFNFEPTNFKESEQIMEFSKDLLFKEFGFSHNTKPRIFVTEDSNQIRYGALSLSNFTVSNALGTYQANAKAVFQSEVYRILDYVEPIPDFSSSSLGSQSVELFRVLTSGPKPTVLAEVSMKKGPKVVINKSVASPNYESIWRDGKMTGLMFIGNDMSDSKYLFSEYKSYYESLGYKFDRMQKTKDSAEFISKVIQSGEADYVLKEDNGSEFISKFANILIGRRNIKGKGQAVVYLVNASREVATGAPIAYLEESFWKRMLDQRDSLKLAGDLIYINTTCNSFCSELSEFVRSPHFYYIAPSTMADTFTHENSTAILQILNGLHQNWSYKKIEEQIERNQDPQEQQFNHYVLPNNPLWKNARSSFYRSLIQIKLMAPNRNEIPAERFYEVPAK
jgi:hypothetical protein